MLAARRKAGKHLAGLWEFPGGKIEVDETPEQCLSRELLEEFGITCRIGPYLGESIYDYGDKIVRLVAYEARHLAGDFQLNDHDALKWLAPTELHSVDWAPADVPLLRLAASLLEPSGAN